jgi:hypothetical protein
VDDHSTGDINACPYCELHDHTGREHFQFVMSLSSATGDALLSLPDLLRKCADGREEYASSAPEPHKTILLAEANALNSAALLAEGDIHTARALLPSWRWREAGLPDV